MANLAPPIIGEGFVYHGALYADVGNLNRHARASLDELTALLRPEKSSAPAPKDQVWHWYVAQLKHYGLPSTKDKNAAKVRLLNALNSGDLKVPADVKKLESTMKKEYDAENKKAKAAAKAAEKGGPSKKKKDDAPAAAKAGAGTKRKRDETAEAGPSNSTTPKPPAKAAKPIAKATAPKAPKATAPKTTNAPGAINEKKPASKSKSVAQLREEERKEKDAARKGPKERGVNAAFRGDRHDPDEYDPWDQAGIESDSISDDEWSSMRKQSGVYATTVSSNGSQWSSVRFDNSPNEVILCKDGDRMWGSYKFDAYEGVLYMDKAPKREIQGVTFEWRGREQVQPGVSQASTGLGEILFEEDNTFKGTFFNLKSYRYEFSGKRRTGLAGNSRRGAKSYDSEWAALGKANGWLGRAPIRVPPGEDFPQGGQYARARPRPKSEPMEIDYDASTDPHALAQITGVYAIDCPDITEQWGAHNLRLLLCVDDDRLWGSFEWGPFYGVIQMNPGPTRLDPGLQISLGWRSRERDTGDLKFGRGCTGYMAFPSVGQVYGELFGLYGESIGFQGDRRPGPVRCGRDPAWFEGQWDGFAVEAYGNRGW